VAKDPAFLLLLLLFRGVSFGQIGDTCCGQRCSVFDQNPGPRKPRTDNLLATMKMVRELCSAAVFAGIPRLRHFTPNILSKDMS